MADIKGVASKLVHDVGKDSHRILILTIIIVGTLTGFATYLMKEAIRWVGYLSTHDLHIGESNPVLLVLPLLSIMTAMILQRYLFHTDMSHGTAMIKRDLKDGKYQLRPSLMYSNIIVCGITIGLGGSAGAEGPSAYTGAAIASNVGKRIGLTRKSMQLFLAIGAGAGIAGIFKSPVGGIFFALEVLGLQMTTNSVIALSATCLISGCTALALGGFAIDIKFMDNVPFNGANILWMCVLGILCGIYSIYYNYTKDKTGKFIDKIKNPWYRALIAGGILSVAIYFFPALFGEGYGIVERIINGAGAHILDYGAFPTGLTSMGMLMLGTLCVLLLKSIMVSSTINGGGVAGDFAPTLFAGCLVGYIFVLAMGRWCGIDLPAENFALMGMAGVMAGAIKAPLTGIFITLGMSNSYSFIFGFMVVGGISYAVVKLYDIRRSRGQ